MTYLICGLLIIIALPFALSKRLRYWVGDVLTSEGERDDSRGPG